MDELVNALKAVCLEPQEAKEVAAKLVKAKFTNLHRLEMIDEATLHKCGITAPFEVNAVLKAAGKFGETPGSRTVSTPRQVKYHVFFSHVKNRTAEGAIKLHEILVGVVPEIVAFLDVEEGFTLSSLQEHASGTRLFVVFACEKYLTRGFCLIELLAAHKSGAELFVVNSVFPGEIGVPYAKLIAGFEAKGDAFAKEIVTESKAIDVIQSAGYTLEELAAAMRWLINFKGVEFHPQGILKARNEELAHIARLLAKHPVIADLRSGLRSSSERRTSSASHIRSAKRDDFDDDEGDYDYEDGAEYVNEDMEGDSVAMNGRIEEGMAREITSSVVGDIWPKSHRPSRVVTVTVDGSGASKVVTSTRNEGWESSIHYGGTIPESESFQGALLPLREKIIRSWSSNEAFQVIGAAGTEVQIRPGSTFQAIVRYHAKDQDACVDGGGFNLKAKGVDTRGQSTVTLTLPSRFAALALTECGRVLVEQKVTVQDARVTQCDELHVTGASFWSLSAFHTEVHIRASTLAYVTFESTSQSLTMEDSTVQKRCDASSMSGSIAVLSKHPPEETCTIRTMSGNVEVHQLKCSATSMSGNVAGIRLQQGSYLGNTSGNVHIESPGRQCQVNTVSGSLSGQGVNDVSFQTVSGVNQYRRVRG